MYTKIVKILWALFLLGVVALVLFIYSVKENYNNWYGSLPDPQVLENPETELSSELYSADGVLLGKYFRQNRTPVRYEDISPNLIDALIASEDIRFYDHSGVDLIGTLAIPYYVFVKGMKRGASTITQQTAKNLFNTRVGDDLGTLIKDRDSFPGSSRYFRIGVAKIKEWILAIQIERAYTKKEIITMYLNTVDYGSNAFGIKVASKTFFNKTPDELNVQEAATLIGLLQSTTRFNPILNPENSIVKRNEVVRKMERYGFVENGTADSIAALPLVTDEYSVEGHNTGLATYFRSEIRKDLLRFCRENGYDLFADGLKIYTTIDSRIQKHAEAAVEKHLKEYQKLFFEHWKGNNPWIDQDGKEMKGFLKRAITRTDRYKQLVESYGEKSDSIEAILNRPLKMRVFTWETPTFEKDTVLSPMDSLRYYKHFLQAGLMAMEPQTGQIKAWVGGINHKYFKYDHVKQGYRQPGSTFKPILYTAAIDNNFHPCFQVADVPITFTVYEDGQPKTYTPKNATEYTNQTYTLRQAMARSINTVAAYMIRELTPQKVVQYAYEKFGIGYLREKNNIGLELQPVPSLALGTSDVSIFELVAAYGTFVNKGIWTEPMYITRIEDKNGKILKRFVPKTIEALSEETAYLMTYMLRGTNEEEGGTSLGLLRHDFAKDNQVGGKTGTTSNYSDAWFMGVTKNLVTGVWVGGEDRSIHFRSLKYGQGAKQAMPAYAYFMENVFADSTLNYTKGDFPLPKKPLSIELDCNFYEQYTNSADTTKVDKVPDMGSAEDLLVP